jgi:hypothetical protein
MITYCIRLKEVDSCHQILETLNLQDVYPPTGTHIYVVIIPNNSSKWTINYYVTSNISNTVPLKSCKCNLSESITVEDYIQTKCKTKCD